MGRAVAELGRDIDLDGHPGEFREPVPGDQPRVVRGSARDDGHLADVREIERHLRQRDDAVPRIEHAVKRVADHGRLLVDLLEHEMGVVSLADHRARRRCAPDLPLDDIAVAVVDHRAVGAHLGPVAFFEITDASGERRERQRVRAEIHLAVAVADGERAAAPGPDHQVAMPGEQDGERKRAFQPIERPGDGFLRRAALAQIAADQVYRSLGIGVGGKDVARGAELAAKVLEILDDAVMNQHHAAVGVGVGVVDRRLSVGCPAGVPDPDGAGQGLLGDDLFEPPYLAFRTTALDRAIDQGRDAGGVVAAIFEPPQTLDQQGRYVAFPDDSDDAAHEPDPSPFRRSASPSSCRGGERGRLRPTRPSPSACSARRRESPPARPWRSRFRRPRSRRDRS